jgi:hypothetical protein
MLKPAPVDVVDTVPHALVVEVDADTCDGWKCGVPAFLYAEMPSGRSLAYCGHHGTQYLPGLTAQGARIIDLRYLIGS